MSSKRIFCAIAALSFAFGAIPSASAWSPNPAKPDISVLDTTNGDFLEIGSNLYLRVDVRNLTAAATAPFFIKVTGTSVGDVLLPCVLTSNSFITFLVKIGPKTGNYSVSVRADYYNSIDEVENYNNNVVFLYWNGSYHP